MKNSENALKDPFVRIVKRGAPTRARSIKVRAWSLVVALLLCLIFILVVGKGKIGIGKAISEMVKGTVGQIGNATSMGIQLWDTFLFMSKLLCVAVALAPAFKMRFWNIGAEGQIVMGGLVAGIFMHNYVSLFQAGLPAFLLVILVSCAAGALWGLIPAFFKAQFGTNETLFTLMMNYIAMRGMDYFYNLWKGKYSSLPTFDESTWLPRVWNHTYTINIIVFFLLAVLMFFYLKKTKQGYEIAVVGESPNTARYAGISVKKVILRTMLISGGICGLCGALTVLGQNHNVAYSGEAVHTVTNGYGFTAIIVAWLAGFNTLSMIPFSLLVIFLQKGAAQLGNSYTQFATGAGNVMIGMVLFTIIGGAFFLNYQLVFRESVAAPVRKVLAPVKKGWRKCTAAVSGLFRKKRSASGKEEK